jgi:hypothetical protein
VLSGLEHAMALDGFDDAGKQHESDFIVGATPLHGRRKTR